MGFRPVTSNGKKKVTGMVVVAGYPIPALVSVRPVTRPALVPGEVKIMLFGLP